MLLLPPPRLLSSQRLWMRQSLFSRLQTIFRLFSGLRFEIGEPSGEFEGRTHTNTHSCSQVTCVGKRRTRSGAPQENSSIPIAIALDGFDSEQSKLPFGQFSVSGLLHVISGLISPVVALKH